MVFIKGFCCLVLIACIGFIKCSTSANNGGERLTSTEGMAVDISAITEVLNASPEDSRELLAYNLAFNFYSNSESFKCMKYLHEISRVARQYSGIDVRLSESYALFKAFNHAQFPDINASNYESKLKDQHNSIDLSNIPLDGLIAFYEITPLDYLDRRHLALKELIRFDKYLSHILQDYPEAECFAFCFNYVLKRDHAREFSIVLLQDFVKLVTDKFDCTLPLLNDYGCISEIYRVGFTNPRRLESICYNLMMSGNRLTFFERDWFDARKLERIYENKIASNITSCFDLLFLDFGKVEPFIEEEVLGSEAVNSEIKLSLDSINYRNSPLFKKSLEFSPEFDELCSINVFWSFLELAFALGNTKLVHAILSHDDFACRHIHHIVNGSNGIDLIMNTFFKKEYIVDESRLLELEKLKAAIYNSKYECIIS